MPLAISFVMVQRRQLPVAESFQWYTSGHDKEKKFQLYVTFYFILFIYLFHHWPPLNTGNKNKVT